MHKVSIASITAIILLFAVPAPVRSDPPELTKAPGGALPRLIVQITVDQLRGDLPLRYQDRFTDGGFRYFLKQGTWYADAHHAHSHTETIVGHTTLATGAYPSRHGMVANQWFDRASGKFIDNIKDAQYPTLSVLGEQQASEGASPTRILTTTFSDELMLTTAGRSRVFGVSVKDRGAVPLAGHAGKAFWFSEKNGCFVSSTFYYTAYPQWVKSWCERHVSDRYKDTNWDLLKDRSTYLYRDHANEYPEGSNAENNMRALVSLRFGRTFPHKFAAGGTFYTALTISPRGDELTLDFVKELVRSEQLGKHEVTDYLAISFSSTDLISHWFSHSSLESEDNLLRLDETLKDLISFIDGQVGLANTLIVISGDHGGPDYPEYLKRYNIDSGWLTPKQIEDAATKALTARFGAIDGLIANFSSPYFYLNRDVIVKNHLDQEEVERTVANGVMGLNGIALAVTSSDLRNSTADTDSELTAELRRNYNRARSGDVYVVQEAQWQIEESGTGTHLLQHGSPWAYDTFVPVAFAGANVPAGMVYRQIYTVDVAATLAALLRTRFPSGSVGVPLAEITARPSP